MSNFIQNDLFFGVFGKDEYLTLNKRNEIDKDNLVLISIHDPDQKIHSLTDVQGFDDVLQIQFWDLEESIANYEIITSEQGQEIREFILKNKNKRFLVHCAAGISRSAGVACAIECLVDFDGINYNYKTSNSDVKSHWRYSPNWTVYDKIIEG